WLGETSADYATRLAFSPDGKSLAACGDCRVGVWDVVSGRNTANFGPGYRPLHLSLGSVLRSFRLARTEAWVGAVAFTADGRLLALGVDGQMVTRSEPSAVRLRPAGVLWGLGAGLLFLSAAYGGRYLTRLGRRAGRWVERTWPARLG